MRLISLDIETTGLDPKSSRIVAAGIGQDESAFSILEDDESILLKELNRLIEQQPQDTLLISWNGEEFDFPYLRARYDETGIHSSLEIAHRSSAVGKYGGAVFDVRWGPILHVDIAPLYKRLAVTEGVPWSLKPIARFVLGAEPVEVDRSGPAIAAMELDALRLYVESDALVTLQLAKRLGHKLSAHSRPAIRKGS